MLIGERWLDRSSAFSLDYLRAVVDEVVVNGNTATSGSAAKLIGLLSGIIWFTDSTRRANGLPRS